MVALPGRARQGRPEEVSLVLVVSPSRRFSVGFRQRQETFTDHLDAGGARSTTLTEALCGAAARRTETTCNYPPHVDRQ